MATQSPLHERHVALDAKFAEFGGWEMPMEYPAGVLKEHAAVRDGVGIFDVSHLGKLDVRGPGAAAWINRCLTNDLDKIAPGKAQYTLCCDASSGGVIDDLIVYLFDADHVLLVPNAANSAEVLRRLEAVKPDGVTITDQHESRAVIAVQGAGSDGVLDKAGLPTGHDYMSFQVAAYDGQDVTVCRTGYTGERGYELIAPAQIAGSLWDALLAGGDVQPCGLGARDTLRTEMGYPLHGQDLSPTVSPLQSAAGWAIGWKKPEFWGREVLLAEKEAGPARRLRGLVAQGRGIARPHMVVKSDDAEVGEVTSGTFSPTLRKGIALARLDAEIKEGTEVQVDVRGRPHPFVVTRPPFVTSGVRES